MFRGSFQVDAFGVVLGALLGASTIFAAATETCGVSAPSRSVLLLIADDLGGGHLGCWGHPDVKSPNIDSLAKAGTRFTHAFAATASCSPSRAVLFTGLHNHANGQYGLAHAAHNFHQRPDTVSVFKLFKEAGYRTAVVGKKHVLPDSAYPVDYEPRVNAKDAKSMGDAARLFFAEQTEKPFFMVAGFTDPHRPFRRLARGEEAPLKRQYDPSHISMPEYLPDLPESRQDVADYYACVSRLDDCVGAVLDALRDAKRESETLVIFVSDNGMPFPGAKTTVYEPGVRLPMIVRSPHARFGGNVCDAMVSFVDVAPTMLEWAQIARGPEGGFHGRSILSLLESPHAAGWDEIFCSHTFHEVTMYYPMRAIRTRTHKLIWNIAWQLEFPFASDLFASPTWQAVRERRQPIYGRRRTADFLHRPEFELYDLESDPAESVNLAASPEHQAVFLDLKARLFRFQERTADPWKVKQTRQ